MQDFLVHILKLFGLPINASAHGGKIDETLGLVHVLMLVLFIGWGAFFVYTLFRFRRSRNPQASYHGVTSHTSSYLELAVAAIEGVLLIGFSIPLWTARVEGFPNEKDATVVGVIAQQFAWNIHYPGPDGVFGRRDPQLVTSENVVGLDREDPAAVDDLLTINQLNLPVDKDVIIHLSSMDVIHSFFLPEMRVKQDSIPGMMIPLHFKPTLTTQEMRQEKIAQGYITEEQAATHNYTIACAQLCGLGHYRMRGMMTVQTQEEFDAWFAEEYEYATASDEDEYYEEEEEGEEGEMEESAEEEAAEESEAVEEAPAEEEQPEGVEAQEPAEATASEDIQPASDSGAVEPASPESAQPQQ